MQSLACSPKLTISQLSSSYVRLSNPTVESGQNLQNQSDGEGEMTKVEKIGEKGKFSG